MNDAQIIIAVLGTFFSIFTIIITFLFKHNTIKREELHEKGARLETKIELRDESVKSTLDDKLSSIVISHTKMEGILERLSDRVNEISIMIAVLETELGIITKRSNTSSTSQPSLPQQQNNNDPNN